jgi:hypothetical protein
MKARQYIYVPARAPSAGIKLPRGGRIRTRGLREFLKYKLVLYIPVQRAAAHVQQLTRTTSTIPSLNVHV